MKTLSISHSLRLLSLLPLIAVTLGAVDAGAQITARELRKVIRQSQKHCPELNCENSRVRVTELTSAEFQALGTEGRAQFRKIARGMALDLWPDTVLEGPYHSVFRIRLDKVQRLYVDGKELGYRLSFSDKAWNTDRCPPVPASKSPSVSIRYRGCETGRIVDAGFVLNNMKTAFRDESVAPTYEMDVASQALMNRGFLLMAKRTSAPVSLIVINEPSPSCEPSAVEAKLVEKIALFEQYIDEERGLYVCDDYERDEDCFEQNSLVTLLTSLTAETDHASLKRDATSALRLEQVELREPRLELKENENSRLTLGSLATTKTAASATFVTDSGYTLCDKNENCQIQFRITCGPEGLTAQEI